MTNRNSSASRVREHRKTLQEAGMRPIQIWVPDTRRTGFAEEARRQSMEVAAADRADPSIDVFLDAALEDLDEVDPTGGA